MDRGVQILPDESVMVHIPKLQKTVSYIFPPPSLTWWNSAEWHCPCLGIVSHTQRLFQYFQWRAANSERNYWSKGCFMLLICTEITLKEMRYLQTPDVSVDLISLSKWSRMTSLMYSYLILTKQEASQNVHHCLPGKNLSDFSNSSLTYFNPGN